MHVRRATNDDMPALAGVMARAFEDDPIFTWVFTDPRSRLRRMIAMNKAFLPRMLTIEFVEMYTTDTMAGIAMWAGPERWEPPSRAFLPAVPRMLLAMGLAGTRKFAATMTALGKVHPHEPHWYLAGLGTDPPHQRTGVGTALVNEVLARCDRDHLPAYLETQKPENVPYYERFGFAVIRELDLPQNGPHMWCMRREAQ